MYQRIAHIALVVDDYDDALAFYTQTLDFQVLEDTPIENGKRWILIAPPGAHECCLLLARAADATQQKAVGNQTGGRVGFFLFTDDVDRDFRRYTDRGVRFVRPLTDFPYGRVAVFEDLYGNLWDLIQPTAQNKGLSKPLA